MGAFDVEHNDMLVGHYDQELCPTSYDVVTFLLQLEYRRLQGKHNHCMIQIQPGPNEGFREDKEHLHKFSVDEKRKWLHNIVIPMCELLPSCNRITNHHVRCEPSNFGEETEHFGFNTYTVSFAHFVKHASAGIRPLRTAYEIPKNKKLVTITLRECEHWPDRNSDVAEWFMSAAMLSHYGYDVRIVRDHAIEPMKLEARAQLYRSAYCNLFVSNGPAWFAVACDAPAIIMRPYTEGGHFMNSKEYFKSIGITTANEFAFNNKHQMVVHDVDKSCIVAKAFERFCEANEA